MSTQSRVDVDVIFHHSANSVFTVGSVTDHQRGSEPCQSISATVGTSAVSLTTTLSSLSTVAVRNSGSTVLRLAGAINVPAGRVAVLPVTSTITVASVSGVGEYTAVCVG